MKRKFIVDYQINGTMHLSCHNSSAAALRSRSLVERAIKDLEEISIYCEDEVNVPIDVEKRYGAAREDRP